ncbi:MAG: flippase-like domain-containing protein, partial [Chloroflexia bacterium]|nr:flippase-like domain-containing protein [Chloroflexia bacterium]
AFPFTVSFAVLMLMTAVVNLFTTIPSTPGYIGTFHAPGIAVLMQAGVTQALATGYTVVLHIALWLPITLLGAVYMLRKSVGWSDMEQAARLKAEQERSDREREDVAPGVAP